MDRADRAPACRERTASTAAPETGDSAETAADRQAAAAPEPRSNPQSAARREGDGRGATSSRATTRDTAFFPFRRVRPSVGPTARGPVEFAGFQEVSDGVHQVVHVV